MLMRLTAVAVLLFATPTLAQNADTVSGPARVVDADIIMVGTQRVILHGIDAPERSQICEVGDQVWSCYEGARRVLGGIIADGEITCRLTGEPDPFNRRFGVCEVAGKDVAAELTRLGYALAYESEDYADEQAEAEEAEVGFFQPNAKWEPPWEWRRTRTPGGFR